MTEENKQEFVFYSDKLNYKTVDGSKGKEYFVEGYISTGDLDLVNDVVTKSCMDSMLQQFDGRSIKLDFEHESFRGKSKLDAEANKTRLPLGKAIDKSRDEKGVMVKWQMNPTWKKFDEKGNVVMTFKDIWTNVESEMLDAFSIAYVPTKTANQDREGKSIRLLDDVNLLNVALTGNPINPMATMSSVMAKSLEFMKDQEGIDMDAIEIKDTELKYKYTKRTGGPGNYTYTYPDGSTSKNPNKKPSGDSGKEKQSKEDFATSTLLNDENSTDKELVEHFMKEGPMSKEEAEHYVSQRDDALSSTDLQWEAKPYKKKESGSSKESKITHENAVSIIKQLSNTREDRQTRMMSELSDADLEVVRDTASQNLSGGNKYSQAASREAVKVTSKELNSRKKKPSKKSADELFTRAVELNLSVGMADRFIKSNLSGRDVDKENMGYKPMVDKKDEAPEAEAQSPKTPVVEGKEPVVEGAKVEVTDTVEAEAPVEPEQKSMTLMELKSVVETLTKDVDQLKTENKDLKAIVEKPLQKAKGAEKKSDQSGAEAKSFKGPIDMIR